MANYKELECIHYDSKNYICKGAPGSYPITPAGLLIHSTGEGTTALKRYVQPSESDSNYNELLKLIGKNKYNNSWNRMVNKGVHYMLGKLENGEYAVAQMLPENICAWGVGKGKKGSYNYNPAYIQIEIQDGNPIEETYPIAVEWAASICKKHGWDKSNITSHNEARLAGYGSGHTDPKAYFALAGKTMDDFRADVQAILDADKPQPTPVPVPTPVDDDIKVGDTVDFIGTKHYTNCNAAESKAKACAPGKATVKSIWKGKKHPYQLRYISGTGCTVNGFVDACDVQKEKPHEFVVGETVLFTGCKQYTNCNKVDTGYVTAKAGTAVIKSIWKGKKHEYQLKGTSVSGYTKASVNGFVNAEDVTVLPLTAKAINKNIFANICWKYIARVACETFVSTLIAALIVLAIGGKSVVSSIIIAAIATLLSSACAIFVRHRFDDSSDNAGELTITIDEDEIDIDETPCAEEEDER